MASLFGSLGLQCEECGDDGKDSTQGYKVVEQRHLCQTCARRLAHAILADASRAAIKWPCPQHEKKEVELYCRNCAVAICPTCGLIEHSGHKMVDILKFFEEKKRTIKKDVEKIVEKRFEMQNFLAKLQKCSKENEKHFSALGEKISVTFQTKTTDSDVKRKEAVEKVSKEAEEKIRKITEERDLEIAEINSKADRQKENLEKSNKEVLSELEELSTKIGRKMLSAKSAAETAKRELDSAVSVADSMIVDCDNKAFHEKIAKFHQVNLKNLASVDKELPDRISSIAKKVHFKRVDSERRIGFLTGKKASFEMVKTIQISPAEIKEPFLFGAIDDKTVAIRDGAGSALYAVDIESGCIDTLLPFQKSRGIWDVVFFRDKGFAYSDYNTGVLEIHDKDGECEHSLRLPNDTSRFAYLAIDQKGMLLAANHKEGEVYVIDPTTGSQLRTITEIECKSIMGFDTLQNGDMVIRSGHTDIYLIYRSSGATRLKLSLADWSNRIDFRVGANNMIYITYRSGSGQAYTGYVSAISPDGVMRKENIIEFPTSFLYRYRPRCCVPTPGTVIVLNGSVLLIYNQMPGVSEFAGQESHE